MPFEEKSALALQAIRPRIDMFRSSLTVTVNQIQGLLGGSGNTSVDQWASMGKFAQGKVDLDRFSSFTRKAPGLTPEVEIPVRAATKVLKGLLDEGDDLFTVKVGEGKGLGHSLSVRLAHIGRAFAAARVIELAKNGAYKEDKHADSLIRFPYATWNSSERAMTPPLLVEVSGQDFKPSAIVPLLDTNMKIIFNVSGDAPAAALSRVVSPGVFVQQETDETSLDVFSTFDGIAVAAYLPATAVSFVHDPSSGSTIYEHFVSLTFPKEVRKRHIGGISPAQQAEDYTLLESLSIPPELAPEAQEDPAGKLSAWLLNQANLSDLST